MVTKKAAKKPLNLTKRVGKMRSRTQAYSLLKYETKLKPIVEEQWEEYVARYPDMDKKKEALRFRNRITKECYDNETDEVKAEVDRRREEGIFSGDEDIELGDDDDDIGSVERQRIVKALFLQRKVFLLFLKRSLANLNL